MDVAEATMMAVFVARLRSAGLIPWIWIMDLKETMGFACADGAELGRGKRKGGAALGQVTGATPGDS